MARPRNADIHEMPDRGDGGALTHRQRKVLEVIRNSIDRRGYPPSMREIGDAVGLASLSSVTHQLNQLELSGYLRRDPNRPRALEILIDVPSSTEDDGSFESSVTVGDAAMVPLVGRIAAGGPILAAAGGGYQLLGIVSWSSGAFEERRATACGGFTAVTPLADHARWVAESAQNLGRVGAPPNAWWSSR